jgi:hypothetical protein
MTSTTPAIVAHQLRARMSKICVSVTGTTAGEMLSRAEEVSLTIPSLNCGWTR